MTTQAPLTPEELTTLVRRLSPARADAPREEWVKVGMAIKSADAGQLGFDLFDQFSRQSPAKYRPRDTLATWRSIRASGGISVGSLVHWANEDDPSGKRATNATTKRAYQSLADYAEAHHTTAEAFRQAGWRAVTHRGRPALEFPTPTGTRWRYLDGQKPTYESPAGYARSWYRLQEAIAIAGMSDSPLILCNGEASTVAAQAHGYGACALAGGTEKGRLPKPLLRELLARWPGELVIAFDCDPPGREAAGKLVGQIQAAGRNARAVDLQGAWGFDLADFCGLHNGSTLAALRDLPDLDSLEPDNPPSSPALTEPSESAEQTAPGHGPVSQRIRAALTAAGYRFTLNELDHWVEVNGERLTDELEAEILMAARDADVRPFEAVRPFILAEAARHRYHPIKDYLDGLQWDGQPHIRALCDMLTSSDPPVAYPSGDAALHSVFLYRWLIGVVAKVYQQAQNLMLVLAGPQGIGKSTLARWLCSGPGDQYFLEMPIDPHDKDSDLRLMRHLIWEVAELDATTRKADKSALKSFITRQTCTVRKSYGRYDTVGSATASFIGTVNKGESFLDDPTGNRRFLVTTLTRIDRAYMALDIHQIWAEAVAHYRAGEPWQLQPLELQAQSSANTEHEFDSALEGWLYRHFDLQLDPSYQMSSAEIIDHLRIQYDIRLSGSERAQAMAISGVLQRMGVERRRLARGAPYVYLGVRGRLPSERGPAQT